jgi:hypothetical protein
VITLSTGRHSAAGLTRRGWLGLLATQLLGRSTRSAWGAAGEGVTRAAGFGRAKSVLLVYTSGGQSQLDLWDPKPLAPREVRGEFESIATSVPGTFLGEHLPQVARLADRFSLIRSMSHDDLDHGSASYLTLTGQFHPVKSSNPPPRPTDFPVLGAVLKRLNARRQAPFPAVHVNGPVLVPETPAPGQDGGLLGRAYEPLVLGDVSRSRVAIPCLDPLPGLTESRVARREQLRMTLDAPALSESPDLRLKGLQEAYGRAYQLLADADARSAFDLSAESEATQLRYGRHRSGQACLLARRLIEAEVPLVTVMWNHNIRGQDRSPGVTEEYGWDTHNDIFDSLRDRLLPRFDQSFSALLTDLDDRGLLAETLVVCLGEFGRAPLVAAEPRFAGSSPGRKHWASVYSLVVAGAGTTPGAVHGASDRIGAYPSSGLCTPQDLCATLFWALGIDPQQHFTDLLDRPLPVSTGRPLLSLWG